MSNKQLFNFGWEFCKKPLGTSLPAVLKDNDFSPVELPHDWLIYNTGDLYETGEGWYRKQFTCPLSQGQVASLRFEGVYMNSTVYLNGKQIFDWKYGYSSFEFDITDALKDGDNEIVVRVIHQSPNSRWYSGAGIYRNVWLKIQNKNHFYTNGIYTSISKNDDSWQVAIDSAVICPENVDFEKLAVRHTILAADGNTVSAALDSELSPASVFCPYKNTDIDVCTNSQILTVSSPAIWDIETPNLYTLVSELICDGKVIDSETQRIGFRTAEFTPEEGFLLNGRKLRINGACEHHDLGCLGSAVNKAALRRQLELLKSMGVNAIRTSHNMPAVELMELADEMGLLVDSEGFDMWERPKTEFDYARFFKDWSRRDTTSWVRRDRNHVSLIMWSIGNEIYDTHADEHGQEITTMLQDFVRESDPKHNAPVTIGSNFMPWEGAQKCADIVKYAGYNYSERYYDDHHKKHPDWIIYGSETASVVQSRGIYHFPLRCSILADDDEQCSSLGNSSTSWGAKNTIACIADDRDTPYSAGQFIWTGFDYIGEPTPYHTKNSYFGQIDTAGFPKDSYYVFRAEWTDYKKAPMVHIFPYWDFNEGQPIDVQVCSNAPKVELFFNDKSLGVRELDHKHGRDDLVPSWQIPYTKGTLRAVAYDTNGNIIATDEQTSFDNAASLCVEANCNELRADGTDIAFLTISALDASGIPVANANNRVEVLVSGAGRLLGLDNGDSTDFEQYKCNNRRLFSGKLLAMIGTTRATGEIKVTVRSAGLPDAEIILNARALTEDEISVLSTENRLPAADAYFDNCCNPNYTAATGTCNATSENTESIPFVNNSVPIRKITLSSENGLEFNSEQTEITVLVTTEPANADPADLIWRVTNPAGIDSNLAKLTVSEGKVTVNALGDGEFCIRCMTKNNTDKIRVMSTLTFTATGLGSATIDPYGFVSGGLYDVVRGHITNGNERGLATARDEETVFGFTNVDFGDFGSDELTLPIFALDGTEYPIEIWQGVPNEENAELLASVVYQKPSQWNVYQEETYKLNRRIKGLQTLCFKVTKKIHFKGFSFTKPNKAFETLSALDHSELYGDTFTIGSDAITGIGNNVSIVYQDMDFGADGFRKLTICGRSSLPKNTIHVRFSDENGEVKQIAEFLQSDDYTEQTFTLENVTGLQTVSFVFLPGCNFDFKWFRFE